MASDPTILGSNNTVAESVTTGSSVLNTILGKNQTFTHLSSRYENKEAAAIGAGGTTQPVLGTDSLFNPFYIFRYAKYGSTDGKQYYPEYHRNSADVIRMLRTDRTDIMSVVKPESIRDLHKTIIENPSAAKIIEYAVNAGDQDSDGTTLGPTPYQWNDFLWCKWYGKMPNNRLLTLRRYPIPVEDNLQISKQKAPLIPIAQAVTWWGGETQNSLNSILGMEYGFNWDPINSDMQNVAGNEVKASDLLDALGLTQAENATFRQVLQVLLAGDSSNSFAATGYDEKLQLWIQDAYGSNGQYWNRVLGPVNVITETQNRKKGFNFTHDITLNFTYKLRSFNNINPKIAMLDLISNFLSLTYNNAAFWGGGIRYFQKTGFILPGMPTEKFENADFIGGAKDVIKYLMTQVQQKGGDISAAIGELAKNAQAGNLNKIFSNVEASTFAQTIVATRVKSLMQTPLTMRALLDGRAVGEWHLTVGNPMDPLAVIGNLCLKTTKIKFSEALGLDDFPTEVTFTVTLTHGRDRAKQDIESMFNLGGGGMYFSALAPPSSAYGSFGEHNSITSAEAYGANKKVDSKTPNGTVSTQGISADISTQTPLAPASINPAENLAAYFEKSIEKAYGSKFSKSPILVDYFKDLKTKD